MIQSTRSPVRYVAAGLAAAVAAAILFSVISAAPSPGTGGEPPPPAPESLRERFEAGASLAGTGSGLFMVDEAGTEVRRLWDGGSVRKIVPAGTGFYLLGSSGVHATEDLERFEQRTAGLPTRVLKRYGPEGMSTATVLRELVDLAVDPDDTRSLAVCTTEAVYVSGDSGGTWKDLGHPNGTSGLVALAFAPSPEDGTKAVWVSHPIRGVYSRKLVPDSKWVLRTAGLPVLSLSTMEEVSGFARVRNELYALVTFSGRLYRFDPGKTAFELVDVPGRGASESPGVAQDGGLVHVRKDAVVRIHPGEAPRMEEDDAFRRRILSAGAALPGEELNTLARSTRSGVVESLSELWMLFPAPASPRRELADRRNGIYLQTGFVTDPATRNRYFDFMAARGLDTLVIDVKDDYGRLRFEPRTPLLKAEGALGRVLDLEAFAKEAKARNIYLVARIVVFKDEVLWKYDGGAFAVFDTSTKAPWAGYRTVTERIPDGSGGTVAKKTRVPYDEYWVDPHCEHVWEYNVAIANEMILRGFDEIQFDYIRFPTDGENLDKASYRWAAPGMDRTSAILSFLAYARENIDAPVGIDIYGANGWFRTGARTGQDVRLLAPYLDVVSPMFYPSHFEQQFLAQPPAKDRPYRIYEGGGLRTAHFARNRVVVRPWVQAFYLDVSYDRMYYGDGYVKGQIAGVRDSRNEGMLFWNNSGRYQDIPVLELTGDRRLR